MIRLAPRPKLQNLFPVAQPKLDFGVIAEDVLTLFAPGIACSRMCMPLVSRPLKGDQHIDIQQEGRHSSSASSSRTFFAVIRGDSADRSKTCRPLTEHVAQGSENPQRTSSDTAFPSPIRITFRTLMLFATVISWLNSSSLECPIVRHPKLLFGRVARRRDSWRTTTNPWSQTLNRLVDNLVYWEG